MNILIANMPIEFNKRENLEPPLGICYLAGMLKDMPGARVFLKDYEVSRFSADELKGHLDENKIEVVGVSFRTASYRSAKEFIRVVKEADKNIFVVCGGHHATAFPKETIVDTGCDAVCIGEGEYTFKELAENLMSKKNDLSMIAGLAYKKNGSVIVNKPRGPIEDLDLLPWPARELLDLGSYNIMTVLTSRGCPFSCIYCDKGVSTRNVKYRSAKDIYEEIKYIAGKLGKKRLYIVDDHFFLKKDRLDVIFGHIIENNLGIKWTAQARADGITAGMLDKAKKAGCEQIMFGIETGDPVELEYIRKSSKLEDAESAVLLTKSAGITARANFMLGFPISTKETARNTIKFAKRIMPDIVRFFAVSPLPNTDLWDDIYGKGHIPENVRWEEMDFYKPSFDIKGMKRDELSLYVSAGYWHVLKIGFIKEVTILFIPRLFKMIFLMIRTGKVRGNISKCFPRTINLVVDNIHQLRGKSAKEAIGFLKKVSGLEKTFS